MHWNERTAFSSTGFRVSGPHGDIGLVVAERLREHVGDLAQSLEGQDGEDCGDDPPIA